jgi:small conductance mechanosensitive channel
MGFQLLRSVSGAFSNLDPVVSQILITSFRIAFLLLIVFLLRRMINALVGRFDRALRGFTESSERLKRARTLSHALQTAATATLFGVTVLLIFGELGLNLAPLLAAAGIGGLAIGFGAQNLVRDIITGFFILLEDQIRVGDVIKIGDKSGQVEGLGLRILTLRDFDGSVHMIPNGTITTVTNMTKDFAYSVVSFALDARQDLDVVVTTLQTIATELRQDPGFASHILSDLEIVGIDEMSSSHTTLVIKLKTAPGQQWRITREIRRRVKSTFAAAHLELA